MRLLFLPMIVALIAPGVRAQEGLELFRTKVRPLFDAHCVKCHGNGAAIKGGLRLTHGSFLAAGGHSGPAIDAANPSASRLLQMTSYKDDHHRMPPAGKLPQADLDVLARWVASGAPWPDEPVPEVEEPKEEKLGRKDGKAGWSYAALKKLVPPKVADAGWPRNGLDHFILRGLEAKGLSPAPEADRVALVRRAYYDLLGLPPTPVEVLAFVNDRRPDAWERLIDDLLSRPQYGEKWGRHWLDLVRYAETNGYERDSNKREIWRYRDWVIKALNEDLPYDRFVTWQLAGDEVAERNNDSIIATGFYRLMQWDDEPGQGRLQARYDVLDDIASTTSEAFLGMTIGCARCHDHKGDPISQQDYYEFMAYFVGVTDMGHNVHTSISSPEEHAARDAAQKKKQEDEAEVVAQMREVEAAYTRALAEQAGGAGTSSDLLDLTYRFYRDTWKEIPDFDMLLAETKGKLESGMLDLSVASREDSIGIVFEGRLVVPRAGRYRFEFKTRMKPRFVVGGREVIGKASRRESGAWVARVDLEKGLVPIRFDYWNREKGYGLEAWWGPDTPTEWQYTTTKPAEGWNAMSFDAGEWKRGRPGFGSPGTPGAKVGTEWRTPDIWMRSTFHWAGSKDDLVFVGHHDEDMTVFINGVEALKVHGYRGDYTTFEATDAGRAAVREGENVIAVHCKQTGGGQYVHVTPVHRDIAGSGRAEEVAFSRRALAVDRRPRNQKNLEHEVVKRGKSVLGEAEWKRYTKLRGEREKVRRRRLPALREAMSVQERGPNPPEMHVHVRGNAHVKGKRVEPATPSCMDDTAPPAPAPKKRARSSGRRHALAQWIVNRDNPVTWRVVVNRVFQHHFGRGIVKSTSDFGELGDRPTHPELLDWLAARFLEDGMSLKKLHRLMMLSSTYRMSSRANAKALLGDPANDLFWRFPMRRLTAEEVRDSMLYVAGVLNLQMGGKSIYSLMPAEVKATASRPNAAWGQSPLDQQRRRSVYIKVKRSLTTPILSNFDVADTDKACPVRFNTTTPTQALHVLNGEFTQAMSQALAERLTRECGTNDAKRVARGLELVTGRRPDTDRVAEHVAFLADLRRDHGLDDAGAIKAFSLICLNMNGFLYLD